MNVQFVTRTCPLSQDGRKEKPKRLVVIGVDRETALCFGSVLVNTKPSPKAEYSEEYLSAQYELKQRDYPEFVYDQPMEQREESQACLGYSES